KPTAISKSNSEAGRGPLFLYRPMRLYKRHRSSLPFLSCSFTFIRCFENKKFRLMPQDRNISFDGNGHLKKNGWRRELIFCMETERCIL
ncbi:hypothetical protein, partial [Mixta calida]|uniref:hypothetical protein n=1 Tax=Mixta calida TaxID=665913 RepID=UPI002898DB2F